MDLRTERLLLREYCDEDIDVLHGFRIDPDISPYMQWGNDLSLEASRKLLQELLDDRAAKEQSLYHFLIVPRETCSPIGEVGLNVAVRNPHGGIGSIGYFLQKAHREHGLATEAVRRVIEFGLGELGLHKISASTELRNTRSIRLLDRIGMKREAILRQESFVGNRWEDIALYAILKDNNPVIGEKAD